MRPPEPSSLEPRLLEPSPLEPSPLEPSSLEPRSFGHPTAFGAMVSTWTSIGLYRLDWTPAECAQEADADQRASLLQQALVRFFQDGRASFDPIQIDPAGWTPFSQRVYQSCRSIPAGTTITYKTLAKMSGSPGAFRAAGGAMARNRILLVIPCHRVIAASGKLQGFSAPGGLETKRRLIELEHAGGSKMPTA